TIKGTCGFLGFSKLESVAHVGENLLSRMRDGQIRLDGEITTALLQTVDAVRSMLSHIETAQTEGDAESLDLLGQLTRWSAGRPAASEPAAAKTAVPVPPPAPEPVAEKAATPAPAKTLDPLDAILEEEVRKANELFR